MNDVQTDLPHDPDLEMLGVYLRVQAEHHHGDLPVLLGRARAHRTRVRLAAGLAAVVLILGVGAALVRGDGGSRIRTIRPADTATTTPWTVNDSVLPPSGLEIWALQVTYDPARWSYRTMQAELGVTMRPGVTVPTDFVGMAGFEDQPELQVYWTGDAGHAHALAAQAALVGLPGIVSAEVGRATATPLATSPGQPGATATTGAPVTTVTGPGDPTSTITGSTSTTG